MRQGRILFRADGNSEIGYGHVMRCLAIAEMVCDSFSCLFMSYALPEILRQQITDVCELLEIPEQSIQPEAGYLQQQVLGKEDVVVLDGYHFKPDMVTAIKEAGCKLVQIDDLFQANGLADAVINHAPGIRPDHYPTLDPAKLNLGLAYAMLRKPFISAASGGLKELNTGANNGHVVITFGGADLLNLCGKFARFCLDHPGIKHVSVAMGAHTNTAEVEQLQAASKDKLALLKNLTADEMCKLMLQSQVLVAPASTVVMEGLATQMHILCGYYTPGQKVPYQSLLDQNLVVPCGDFSSVSPVQFNLGLDKLLAAGLSRKVIDGQQPERFKALFLSLQTGIQL